MLATVAFAIWGVAIIFVLAGTYLSLQRLRRATPPLDRPFGLYPVSILKPLKGVDPQLEENLKTFFNLRYPRFELIFSVADKSDPAVPVVEKLRKLYPRVATRLIITGRGSGHNPKVENLLKPYQEARYDWLLVSDSNVSMDQDLLKKLMAHIDAGVGVVTCVISGQSPRGLGGYLEATFLNTFYARWMFLCDRMNHPCVVGKSMLFRRSTADRFGGLAVLNSFLAEDYMTGEAMRWLGLRVVLASEPIPQFIGSYSLKSFWQRHLRWGRIRKAHAPLPFVFEPLFNSIPAGIIGTWAMAQAIPVLAPWFFVAHFTLWFLCDFAVYQRLDRNPGFPVSFIWVLREILAVPLWFHIAIGKTVNWRGNKLVLGRGGLVQSHT